jgi:hypothetical protein
MSFKDDSCMITDLVNIKKQFDYDIIIETGTNKGESLEILKNIFKKVYTCEIVPDFYQEVQSKPGLVDERVVHELSNSPEFLKKYFTEIGHDKFFLYLDAHWYDYCPLYDELQVVKDFNFKPVIIIHDFNTKNGFAYGGAGMEKVDFSLVEEKIKHIYGGENTYITHYNTKSDINRGCAYFYPKQ